MIPRKYTSKLFTLMSFTIVASAAIYLSKFILKNFTEISNYGSLPSFQDVAVSLLLTLLAHGWNVWLWKYSLRKSQLNVRISEAYLAWSVSRLARYIPGKVFSYIARARLHKQRGSPSIVNASILEALSALAATVLIGLISALAFRNLLPESARAPIIFFCISILAGIFLLPYFATRKFTKKYKIVGESVRDVTGRTLLRLSILQAPLIALHGTAFFIILTAQTGIGLELFLYVVISYYLAGLMGQIAVFSPAGLGVKEAGLVFLLAPAIPGNEAALLYSVVIIRLILVASECIHAITAIGLQRLMMRVAPR